MKHAPMRFCGYTLHHNPKSIEIKDKRNLAELKVPYGGSLIQDMGNGLKMVTGNGEFFGPDCMCQYQMLLSLLREGRCGLLSLSGYGPIFARLASLELSQPPAEDFLSYRFVFMEERKEVPANFADGKKFHTAEENETLWDIAFWYGASMETLINKNPQIRRPDCLKAGMKVRLP